MLQFQLLCRRGPISPKS